MPREKASRIIIDTNVWISFLIGKELQNLKDLILNDKVKIILTDQLINEIKVVTSRDKLKKYFNQDKVTELISLLDILTDKVNLRYVGIPKTTSC